VALRGEKCTPEHIAEHSLAAFDISSLTLQIRKTTHNQYNTQQEMAQPARSPVPAAKLEEIYRGLLFPQSANA